MPANRTLLTAVSRRALYVDRHGYDHQHVADMVDFLMKHGSPGQVLREVRRLALEVGTAPYDFAGIECPLLVVHGSRDRIIPVRASHRLHGSVPHSELHVLPNIGHFPQLDAPDEVARLILDFVARALGDGQSRPSMASGS